MSWQEEAEKRIAVLREELASYDRFIDVIRDAKKNGAVDWAGVFHQERIASARYALKSYIGPEIIANCETLPGLIADGVFSPMKFDADIFMQTILDEVGRRADKVFSEL